MFELLCVNKLIQTRSDLLCGLKLKLKSKHQLVSCHHGLDRTRITCRLDQTVYAVRTADHCISGSAVVKTLGKYGSYYINGFF